MDIRRIAPLALAFLLAAGSGCAPAEGAPIPLTPGSAAPAEWWTGDRAAPATYLVWVARTEDCLSCQDVDFEFRRVQARWPGEVPLVMVHVGSVRSETVPRAFLQSRRVEAHYQTVAPGAFDRRYSDAVVPAVYLVNDGSIVWSSANLRTKRAGRLDSLVSRYLP